MPSPTYHKARADFHTATQVYFLADSVPQVNIILRNARRNYLFYASSLPPLLKKLRTSAPQLYFPLRRLFRNFFFLRRLFHNFFFFRSLFRNFFSCGDVPHVFFLAAFVQQLFFSSGDVPQLFIARTSRMS